MSATEILGVPVMDADHAAIEAMFAAVAAMPDGELAAAYAAIAAEIAAHFGREEAVMAEAGVPILHCHLDRHARLLDVVAAVGGAVDDPVRLRRGLGHLAAEIGEHVATVDRITAGFIVAAAQPA